MTQRLIIFLVLGVTLIYLGIQYNNRLDKEALEKKQVEQAVIDKELETKMADLKIEDQKIGTGAEATPGKKVTVNYRGTLTNGTEFDSSFRRNQPFIFTLGQGEVIQGWDLGVKGMKVGGKRILTIPSELGYGANGVPGTIPGGATLIFEVDLLAVE